MKTKPYVLKSSRIKQFWTEVAQVCNCHQTIASDVFFNHWWRTMDKNVWLSLLKNNSDRQFSTQVLQQIEELKQKYNPEQLDQKQKENEQIWLDCDFGDLIQYRLKQLVEVGDEWLCCETKTFISGQQYLTKGKKYQILSLCDNDQVTDFSATTNTDLPNQINYSVFIQSLWRNNVEIWNWHKAFLELWLEQNPNHEQRQEMIEHCTKKAEESIVP